MTKNYVGAAFLLAAACASSPPTAPAVDSVRPIVIGESRTIQSDALGAERTINIWTPPGYATSEKRYPVLYVIDGGLEQDFHHISGLAQLGAITSMFEEMIVVGVETKDRRAELTWRPSDPAENRDFPTNGANASFRKFLTGEVMPLVAAAYRVSGEDALIGESLAGLFIAESFLKAPETADVYIAISPSLWWDFASLGKEARARLDNYSKGEREIYLSIANEKGAMREGVLAIVAALKKEKPKGVAWTFSDRPDLEHATIYHREALDALVWAFPRKETAP